jgi:hypothetical protein
MEMKVLHSKSGCFKNIIFCIDALKHNGQQAFESFLYKNVIIVRILCSFMKILIFFD